MFKRILWMDTDLAVCPEDKLKLVKERHNAVADCFLGDCVDD